MTLARLRLILVTRLVACCAMGLLPSLVAAQSSAPSVLPMAQIGSEDEGDFQFTNGCGWFLWDVPFWFSVTATTWLDDGPAQYDTAEGLGDAFAFAQVTGYLGRSRDVVWHCHGHTNFGWSFSYAATHAKREPVRVRAELDVLTSSGFGNYERWRLYLVEDNYDRAYGYRDAPVEEVFIEHSDGCNLTVETDTAYLNGQGRFQDTLTTCGKPMPACENHPQCVSTMTQRLEIDRSPFLKDVVWSCTDVQVTP